MVKADQDSNYARFVFDGPSLAKFLETGSQREKSIYTIRFNKGAFRLHNSNVSNSVKASTFLGAENLKLPFELSRLGIDCENLAGKMLVVEILLPNKPQGFTQISTYLATSSAI